MTVYAPDFLFKSLSFQYGFGFTLDHFSNWLFFVREWRCGKRLTLPYVLSCFGISSNFIIACVWRHLSH